DLRVAIRPDHSRPSPKAHLPGYFQRESTTLRDGTVVVGQSQADIDERERLAKKYELSASGENDSSTGEQSGNELVVQTQTVGEDEQTGQSEAKETEPGQRESESRGRATEEQLRILSSLTAHAAKQAWGVDHPDPLAKNPLPITRAERRRLIKEEIQRLAQTDKPVYYQRRLW
ncbi:hypothetical protein E4U55_007132, partial [Claviceps digitariae]